MQQIDAKTFELLQRYSDGELVGDEAREVDAMLAARPELGAVVQQLRDMKAAVQRVMSDDAAPPAVSARVRAALAAEPAAQPTVVGRITPDEDGRMGWVNGPRRMNLLAMVATLTIVSGAVLFGIFGPRIDDLNRRVSQPDLTGEAVLHAEDQHQRCGKNPDYRERKTRYKSAQAIVTQLGPPMGEHDLVVPDLQAFGYELVGGGPCAVPGCAESTHIIYMRQAEGRRPAMLSVFIAGDHGQYGTAASMEPGSLYASDADGKCRGTVHMCTDGLVVYFIAGCDPYDSEGIARHVAGLLAQHVR